MPASRGNLIHTKVAKERRCQQSASSLPAAHSPLLSGAGRVSTQAIVSGSARLRPLIAGTTRRGLRRLAFTTRLAKTAYLHPSGSRTP